MHRRSVRGVPWLAPGHLGIAFRFALISGAYVGAAKLGINLNVAHGVITPVWAPSGIALAALLLFGLRYWPAVALGAFVANLTSDAGTVVALGIAVGNTLEALVGAALVRRFGFRAELDRVRAVIALAVGGALISTAIAATNGVTVLTLAGDRPDSYGAAWILWWFGDAVGDLMVAPLLLVLYAFRHARMPRTQILEGIVLLVAVAGVSAIVFLAGAWRYPYLLFPLLLWAALRFKSLGAATVSFLVGAIGTWGAVIGEVPVGVDSATEQVQVIQALFALVAVSLLVVGATVAEREAGSEELLQAASRLEEAQALAHIGSWEWDIRRDIVTWSDELYRIFGMEPGPGPVNYAEYLERLHPSDRAFVDEIVSRARAEGRSYAFEYRIVRSDGEERVISARGRVIVEGGETVAMVGTSQDVTEQRQADRLREDILSAVSHELRTPLTAVLGFAVTLEQRRRDLSDEEVETIVRELTAAARRPTDILELVERVVGDCELDGRRVSISGGPISAYVDAAKLERMVENLIVNAAKHTPRESSIRIRLDAEGEDLLLVVDDDGPGIPDEFKEGVFETFNRGPSIRSATPGAGIGLSLVARFAEAHGGRSWVEDRPGGGASFHVVLPGSVS
jgi:PAS domain S-box-containing protein